MTSVQLTKVRKQFGDFTAIDNLDLEIASGELVALLGPSGCGKTTTLRMIAGLERPSAGAIFFDGQDISDRAVQERNVGMVAQRYALFPHMTVEKNVAFGLSVRGVAAKEISARVDEILDVVQLESFRTRFPAQLSGGQMQRVAIARTLVTKPKVLMMDEPLASLDTKLRGEMRRFIRNLQRQFGITTIFVTHDQIEAMELADRVAVILDGQLAQFDTPQQVHDRPASLEVADFMGTANIIPGKLVSMERVATEVGEITCVAPAGIDVGDAVHVLLRAEALDLIADGKEPARENAFEGPIVEREFFGTSVTYRVKVGSREISVSENARTMIDTGSEVRITITPERVWLLKDRATNRSQHNRFQGETG